MTAVYAAGVTVAAWRLGARGGTRGLVVAWLLGGILYWALSMTKFRLQGMCLHLPPQSTVDRLAIYGFLGYGFTGSGLTVLVARKALWRNSEAGLTRRVIARGIGAFFAGMLVVLLVIAIDDIGSLVRSGAP